MIINADFSQLEFVTAAYLSRDKVAMQEIKEGIDQHALNMEKWGLPSRRIAKYFIFRILYGGRMFSADPMFNYISADQHFWDDLITQFYTKYEGIREWHNDLMLEATRNGKLVMPTGRVYYFTPKYGRWPKQQILNYPVQGLAADLVSIARVSLYRRLSSLDVEKIKLISSIHDSIVLDVDNDPELCYTIMVVLKTVINDVPQNFERLFKTPFDLPLRGDISYGYTKKELKEWQPEVGPADLMMSRN